MDTSDQTQIVQDNWNRVLEEVRSACEENGRSAHDVLIVGVSKYVPPETALLLAQAGCRILGENRPQHLWEVADEAQRQGADVEIHMIGHLQRNKVARTLPQITCLHSLDSLRLAKAVSEAACQAERTLECLLEVNVTQDAQKTGATADDAGNLAEQILALPGIKLTGLMGMTTLGASVEVARGEFEKIRNLRDQLQQQLGTDVTLGNLSMGMSGDFREAIAEGSTMVRIGSSLWEGIR